ncbi:MAG: hypothetical protein R3B07_13955 [Polyangiaceae bacterium]
MITNQSDHFSVGANLFGVVMAAQQKQWDSLDKMIHGFQQACQKLKYAKIPVVAAPYGMTVGGLEVCLGADVQVYAETCAGLVEVGVGLIPGGGGCLNLTWRALENAPEGADVIIDPLVAQVFKNIAMANVATSAMMAQHYGYFRQETASRGWARQLYEAKRRAIALAETGYHLPAPRAHKLLGESGIATISMLRTLGRRWLRHRVRRFHRTQARLRAVRRSGGAAAPSPSSRCSTWSARSSSSLCGEQKSQERMQHMLMNNKPLRN